MMHTREAWGGSSKVYFLSNKAYKRLRTQGKGCMPPFLPGYSGPKMEASSYVEFPLSSRACQAHDPRGHGSPWFRQSRLIIFPASFLQGLQACREQGLSGSCKAA